MHHKQHKAFTLIELLIVVAIIGILAAIAVPNFLEAQARSKIARVKADMRTLATGIETYRVDYNWYPLPGGVKDDGTIHIPTQSMAGYANKFIPPALTTPVSYMSSLPLDIFYNRDRSEPKQTEFFFYTNLEGEKIRFAPLGQWKPPHEYRLEELGKWAMWSCGPDGDRIDLGPPQVPPLGPLTGGYYDATNGTISNGDIIRTHRHTNLGG
ncbi:MAG: type IV pilin protein [Candidatus Sumerlaeota bacterium]